MQIVVSAQPRRELRPFVRAFAQRVCPPDTPSVLEFVPAQLEQVMNFEFGTMPGIRHQDRTLTDVVLIGGAQSSFSGQLELRPGVESFAIFFQPAGFSVLFGLPLCAVSNQFDDATAVDPGFRSLWNRLGEVKAFASRIGIVELSPQSVFRLNEFAITLPPLQERKEDIPALACHFLAKYFLACRRVRPKAKRPALTERAMHLLQSYPWPGQHARVAK